MKKQVRKQDVVRTYSGSPLPMYRGRYIGNNCPDYIGPYPQLPSLAECEGPTKEY